MKKIILIILMLFAAGCTVEYDLTIDDVLVTEKLSLSSEENDVSHKEEFYADYLDEYPIFEDEEFLYYNPTEKIEGVEYYKKNITETNYGYNAVYESNLKFKDLERSRLLNTAFVNYNIGYNQREDYYYINAQNIKLFDYNDYITKLQVNINIGKYELIESNSTNIIGNNLSWNFVKNNNNENDRIILKYKEKAEEVIVNPNNPENNGKDKNEKKEVSKDDMLLVIFSLFGFIIILILIIILSKKKQK